MSKSDDQNEIRGEAGKLVEARADFICEGSTDGLCYDPCQLRCDSASSFDEEDMSCIFGYSAQWKRCIYPSEIVR